MLTDAAARYHLWLSNGVLIHRKIREPTASDVVLTTTGRQLSSIAVYGLSSEALKRSRISIDGDGSAMDRLNALLEPGDPNFNIVTP